VTGPVLARGPGSKDPGVLVIRPTSKSLFERALGLSRELGIAGYDAIYLAHAEDTNRNWLTADEKAARQLASHPRVKLLQSATA